MTHTRLDPHTLHLIRSVPYFTGLDDESLDTIGRNLMHRNYSPDEVVFVEGEPCAGLYIVHAGWVKTVKISPDGREQSLNYVGPGQALNVYGVYVTDTNSATAITLEAAKLCVIDRATILRLLELKPCLALAVIRDLAGRVEHLMTLVEDLSLRTVEARLARYLLDSASEDILHRPRWATQAELAARLGTVSDVLNRAFRSLVDENLIRTDRRQIEILDRRRLEARAGLEE